MRQRRSRGLTGSGTITSTLYEDKHWDDLARVELLPVIGERNVQDDLAERGTWDPGAATDHLE
jgi:hypothetical protein